MLPPERRIGRLLTKLELKVQEIFSSETLPIKCLQRTLKYTIEFRALDYQQGRWEILTRWATIRLVKTLENTNPQGSKRKGPRGWYERSLRKYQRTFLSLTLVVFYLLIAILLGFAAAPGIGLGIYLFEISNGLPLIASLPLKGFSVFLGFLVFGFFGIVLVPLPNRLILKYLKPRRGPYFSTDVFPWYAHNILAYSIRYTFLDWITPTPFNLFFFRQMGMKIGVRTELNSSNISDPGLITLEDEVTIGGSATLVAHYAVRGYLIIAPVRIRKGATIGLRAIIMGDTDIGEGAKILPNSVVLPKSRVPAGETWGGIPARKIEPDLLSDHQG